MRHAARMQATDLPPTRRVGQRRAKHYVPGSPGGRVAPRTARIYDETDGHRILVDRLWPRGVSKAAAPWHEWRKDLAPSDGLRKAFHAGELDFEAFAGAYREELDALDAGPVPDDAVLLTAAKDPEKSHAAVLRDWLQR